MPQKTLYVSERDLPLWEEAEKLGGGNISATVTQALRMFVAFRKPAEERRQITAQYRRLLSDLADQIAAPLPVGTAAEVEGRTYRVVRLVSNVHSLKTLEIEPIIQEEKDGIRAIGGGIFTTPVAGPMGGEFYLHDDINCLTPIASRRDHLHFANNAEKVTAALGDKAMEAVEAFRRVCQK